MFAIIDSGLPSASIRVVEVEISKQDVLPWEAQLLLGLPGRALGSWLGSNAVDAHCFEASTLELTPDGSGV